MLVCAAIVLASLAAGAPPAEASRDERLNQAVTRPEARLTTGQVQVAESSLRRAAQLLRTGEAYVALGRFQERTGVSLDNALESFSRAKALGTEDADVLTQVALFELRTAPARQALETAKAASRAPAAGAEAKAALSLALSAANDPFTGLKTAEEAVSAAPRVSLTHEAKGQALFLTDRVPAALESLRRAVELDRGSVTALVKLSVVLASRRQFAEAEAAAGDALRLDKNSAEAMAAQALAIAGADAKRWSEAISQAQQAAFMNPRGAFVHLAAGKVFEAGENLDQARQAYERAIECDPGYVAARVALFDVQLQRGDWKAASGSVFQIVKEAPSSAEACVLLGRVHIAEGDFTAAAAAFARAAEALPDNATAHGWLGALSLATGDLERAIAALGRARALDPDEPEYAFGHALGLSRAGRTDEGLAVLRGMVETPGYDDPLGFIILGYVYRSAVPPRYEEGRGAYERARQLTPPEPRTTSGFRILCGHESVTLSSVRYVLRSAYARAKEDFRRALWSPPPAWAEEDLGDIRPSLRRRAIRNLAMSPSGPTVERLIVILSGDEDFSVREAAVAALPAMGDYAKPAIPHIESALNLNCQTAEVRMTPAQQIAQEIACEDLRRTSRRVLQKLRVHQ